MIAGRTLGLEELEGRMRELLTLLDGAQAGVEALGRVWSECATQAPALERVARSASEATVEERAVLRAQLERLVQLNAAARQAVQREQDAITRGLTQVRGARASLDHLAAAPSTGESCDVSA